jgi:acid phosphatase
MDPMRRMQSRLLKLAFMAVPVVILSAATSRAQPANIGDAKAAVMDYVSSHEYDRDLTAVDAKAMAYLDAHVAGVAKPAIVLDIDETSLSNLLEIEADDFGYIKTGPCPSPIDPTKHGIPCGSLAWDQSEQATAIAPTLALYKDAIAKHVTVFFITGRRDVEIGPDAGKEFEATRANLVKEGYDILSDPNVAKTNLILEDDNTVYPSAADFKAPARKKIVEAGYDILVNVGDQPSDLIGGHADAVFLLPDPFYRIN